MKRTIPLACLVLLLAAGCTLPGQSPPPAPPNSGSADSAALSENPLDAPRRKIEAHLRARRYPEALALIRAERGKERDAFAEEYLRALQALAATADRRLGEGDPLAAGKLVRTLLDHYPENPALARRFGRTRQDVQAQLDTCADRLMERGLTQYRASDLEGAIRTWKRVLVFHPEHDGARKVIQTADAQLKKLRTLP